MTSISERSDHLEEFYFFKYFIYLFLERGEGREKERERNTIVRNVGQLPLSRARSRPNLKPGAPPRTEPTALHFTGKRPNLLSSTSQDRGIPF